MPAPIAPIIIIWCGLTKIFCFSDETYFIVYENNKEVKKKITDIKSNDMVLAHNGKEKKYAKIIRNSKFEGNYEFFVIKMRNNSGKTKEIKVTGDHVMITFNDNKEMSLMNAKDLKGNEFIDTDDGLYKIYEIGKENKDNKYFLIAKGGVVYANGIFVSTICSKDEAKIIKPTSEEWEKYQEIKNIN